MARGYISNRDGVVRTGPHVDELLNKIEDLENITQAEITAGTGVTGRKITPKALRDNFYTEDEVDGLLEGKANSNDLAIVAMSGSYNDLTDKPDFPSEQLQSDWNQSNTSAKDFIKNKSTIPTVPTNVSAFTNDAGYLTEHQDISGKVNTSDLAEVAFSGDYEDLENTPAIPDVPEWAMASTKPSYTVSEIDGAQEELVSGTNIKTINNESILGSGNITIQGGGSGGDVNVIEGVKVNGTSLTPDSNKDVDIPQASASGFGVVRMSTDSVVNNQSELNDAGLTGIYGNALFVKAATTTQGGAITPAMVTKLNGLNAVTESTVSGWGFTKNTGTYSKPNGGIPKTDLADAVQTSLGKADTALQSFTESDPTVPSHVKGITTTDISNWNGKQAAIADLSDIRSGAALGATALQSFTETDPTVPAWAKAANKPSYTASEVGALPDTTTIPTKVSDLTNDSEFTSNTGTITGITMNGASKGTSGVVDLGTVLTEHQDISSKANSADLATVATSGSYNDLSDKPTIPAAQVNSDWNASSGVAQILNKPTIPTVPTALSAFTDDLGSNPTHTHSQYLTSAPVTSVNGQTGAVSLTIPAAVTESTVSGWGFTKNTGNVGSTTVSSIVTLTEAQYEALSTKDSSTLYIITSS